MVRITTLINLVATVVIWAAVLAARLVGGSDLGIMDFMLFAGVGTTIALWTVWAFVSIDFIKNQSERGKVKRASPEAESDARLSLLLQLLDEDERRTLRQRLRDDLRADGAAVALEDLLGDTGQDRRARRG